MKKLLVAVLAVIMLGCGPSEPEEPEIDWDEVQAEMDRIDSLLNRCLEGTSWHRHSQCYDRAIWRLEDLAIKYGIDLDEEY